MAPRIPLTDAESARVAEVFEAHRRFIEAVAAAQVNGDQTEAAEIVQDVAMRICRRLSDLRASAALQSWIYRLTVNVARDRRRWRVADAAGRERFGTLRPSDPAVDPDAEVIAAEEGAVVRAAVRRLPARQRAIVSARFGLRTRTGGRSFAEVGAALGVSLSYAHKVNDAAMDRLRESLGKVRRPPDD